MFLQATKSLSCPPGRAVTGPSVAASPPLSRWPSWKQWGDARHKRLLRAKRPRSHVPRIFDSFLVGIFSVSSLHRVVIKVNTIPCRRAPLRKKKNIYNNVANCFKDRINNWRKMLVDNISYSLAELRFSTPRLANQFDLSAARCTV